LVVLADSDVVEPDHFPDLKADSDWPKLSSIWRGQMAFPRSDQSGTTRRRVESNPKARYEPRIDADSWLLIPRPIV